MKLKAIRLLLVPATLMFLLTACGGSAGPVDSSITPTRVPSTPIPTQAPPEPTSSQVQPMSVDTQQDQAQQSTGPILQLKVSEIPMTLPDYDRGDWRHWRDEDGDCQNTRHEGYD